MRLNAMEYSAEQRVFIQEELDSCLSQQHALQAQEKTQYRGIYEQFAADSAAADSTAKDSVAANSVTDSTAGVPSAHP